MINTRKFLLIVSIILISAVTIGYSIFFGTRNKEEVKGIRTTSCTPYIVNVIPNIAYVNQEYFFIPEIIDCGDGEVSMEINGANWLKVVNNEYIYGIPSSSDVGTDRIELIVETALGSTNLVEYVIVKEYEK